MEFQDKTLVCKDCGKEFIFSAGEQAFYAEKGFETNRHVAMNAVIKDVVNAVAKHSSVRCTLYSAHSVEKKRKFRLNRKVTALFIVVTA